MFFFFAFYVGRNSHEIPALIMHQKKKASVGVGGLLASVDKI